MKTLVVNRNKIVSILAMFAFLVLATAPALANEFEFGTQFGVSHLVPETDYGSSSVTLLRVPSGDIGSALSSPYLTWFPNKQFAVRPEFSLTMLRLSQSYTTFFGGAEEDHSTVITPHLGCRFEFYLSSYEVSNPYGLIWGSTTAIFDEDDDYATQRLGVGVGYQWRIGDNYVLRAEGKYLRAFAEDENVNGFTFVIGIGARFGSNRNQQ